jgi:heptosyltransferase-3
MNRRARFLILRGGAIGDFILTLPVLQALRGQWPDAYIELIGYPHIANLALAANLVDHVESLDRAGIARFFTPTPTFTEEQAAHIRSFDVVFTFLHDPESLVRDNLTAAGAQMVLYGSPLVTDGHAVDHLIKPLETLAIYASGATPRLTLDERRRERGREWLIAHGCAKRPVALHPGSGSPRKNWPADRFVAVARKTSGAGCSPFFVIGEADDAPAKVLRESAADYPVLRDATLVDVASVLSHCAAYVGNDSGITHIAAALGIPAVALFGASDPDRWGPRGDHVHILRAPAGQLDALDVSVVWAELEKILPSARGKSDGGP